MLRHVEENRVLRRGTLRSSPPPKPGPVITPHRHSVPLQQELLSRPSQPLPCSLVHSSPAALRVVVTQYLPLYLATSFVVLKICACCGWCRDCSDRWILFHYVSVPFCSSFIHGWTFGLFPHLPVLSSVAVGLQVTSLGLVCRQTVGVRLCDSTRT